MLPAQVLPGENGPCSAVVVLHQGVYHQIKRMFGVYGAGVRELRRVAIGQLWLDERLGPGGWRELTAEEVEKITAGRLPVSYTHLDVYKRQELTMYIVAGKKKLADVRENQLPKLVEKAKASGLPEDAQAAKDLEDLLSLIHI